MRSAASSFGGEAVTLVGGNDISVHGSNVVGDRGTTLSATNNVTITAAQNSYSSSQFSEDKKSGLMGSGGIGFTIGKRSQSGNGQESGTTAAGSTVGAIDGNVVIRAGNTYTQTGSDVVAPGGDVDIRAKRVAITEARETRDSRSEQQASQSGLTVSLTSPVVSGAQAMANTARAVGQTGDGRMKALGAATIALQGNQLAGSLGSAESVADGIRLDIALGSSHSHSSSTAHSDTAEGSTVKAGGNVSIVATGAGQDSNLLIQGSDVSAGGVARLRADNKVILRAADNNSNQSSDNSASSSSFGVSVGLGKAPVSLNASASRANGNANGSDAWSSNTHVGGGSAVDIQSGGDLVMDGAVVAANRVKADVGGNLLIGSRQDTSRYTSQQSSSSASLSVTPSGVPTGGSLGTGRSNVTSTFASVGETSGIRAGDGGFDVQVKGRTVLDGGQITSTDAAVAGGLNSYHAAGGTTYTDLTNTATYSGSGYSVGVSVGKGPDGKGGEIVTPGGSAGVGSTGGSASSVTRAGISGIGGDAAVRTGDTPSGITPIFDAAKVQREVNAQVQITAAFGQQATRAVGDYAQARLTDAKALRSQAANETNPGKVAELNAQASALESNWGDNGTLRVAAHTAIGALTGGTGGAAGAFAGTLAAPAVAQALADAGITGPLASTLTAAASTAAGALAGGASGAAAGFNEVTNNYLNHNRPSMLQLSERERYDAAASGCAKGDQSACRARNELASLSSQRDAELARACAGNSVSVQCNDAKAVATGMGNSVHTTPSGHTFAISPTSTPLNVSTIGPVVERPDQRIGSFHDAVTRSTAEALVLEAGNQLAGSLVATLWQAGQTAYRAAISSGRGMGSAAENIYSNVRPLNEVFPELDGVNPYFIDNAPFGVNTNCISCANAVQQRLTGADRLAIASPSNGYGNFNDLLPSAPFGFDKVPSTPLNVTNEMLVRGDGATSPLVIKQPGGIMHVITVTNRQGKIYYIDGQMGRMVSLQLDVPVFLGRPN